jgi:hypothetical protein
MFVSEVAGFEDAIVLIKGRPILRAIERLSYRCLNRSVLIAFFTWDDALAYGPHLPGYNVGHWCGPFPSLNDDSNVRTFYSYPQGVRSPVRVDLFLQSFGSIASAAETPSDLDERLGRLDRLLRWFGKSAPEHVPPELSMLGKSLRWSADKFRSALELHRETLEGEVGAERLRSLIETGVLAVEPEEKQAARLATNDRPYIQEHLFAKLQDTVEKRGLLQGLIDFLLVQTAAN